MAGLAAVCTLWPVSSFDRWGLESTGRRHSRESGTRHRSRNLFYGGRRHRDSGELRRRPIVGQGELAGDFLLRRRARDRSSCSVVWALEVRYKRNELRCNLIYPDPVPSAFPLLPNPLRPTTPT